MAELSLLSEVASDAHLAGGSPEQQCKSRGGGPIDLFLPSGKSISGLLSTMRQVCVRAVRPATGRGTRLSCML